MPEALTLRGVVPDASTLRGVHGAPASTVHDALILVGVVGRPHGVRGLVHVHAYTEDPAALATYAPLLDSEGRRWSLAWRSEGVAELRDAGGRALADRSAAERLTNLRLHVPRDRLPATGEDEFYLADLVGLAAVDPHGAALGRVGVVHDYGAGTSLELVREGAAPLLVPFTRAAVPEVDVAGGRVVVVLPAEREARPDAPEAVSKIAAGDVDDAERTAPAEDAAGVRP